MHTLAKGERAGNRQGDSATIQCCYLTAKPEMPFGAIQICKCLCPVNFGCQDIIIKGSHMQGYWPAKLSLIWPVIGDIATFQNKAILKIIALGYQERAPRFIDSDWPIGHGIMKITAR